MQSASSKDKKREFQRFETGPSANYNRNNSDKIHWISALNETVKTAEKMPSGNVSTSTPTSPTTDTPNQKELCANKMSVSVGISSLFALFGLTFLVEIVSWAAAGCGQWMSFWDEKCCGFERVRNSSGEPTRIVYTTRSIVTFHNIYRVIYAWSIPCKSC